MALGLRAITAIIAVWYLSWQIDLVFPSTVLLFLCKRNGAAPLLGSQTVQLQRGMTLNLLFQILKCNVLDKSFSIDYILYFYGIGQLYFIFVLVIENRTVISLGCLEEDLGT